MVRVRVELFVWMRLRFQQLVANVLLLVDTYYILDSNVNEMSTSFRRRKIEDSQSSLLHDMLYFIL
jgi:hypothetical protein